MLADVVTECERRTASCESPDDFRKVIQDVITERNQADVRLTEQGRILENALNQNSKVNDDNKYLRGIMNIILEQYRKEHTENVSLNEKVTLLRYELFGQKSEKSKYNSSSAETEANEAETGSKTEADNVNEVSGTAAGNADEVSASDIGKAPEGKVDLKDPVFDGVDREALSIVLAAKAADEAQAKAAEETEAGPPEGDAEKEGKGKGKGNGKGKENGKDKSKGEGNNKDKKGKDSDKDSNKDMDKQGNGEKDSGNEQDNENKYGKTPKGRERQREGGKKGHKRPGKRKKDLSGLPQTFELEDRTAEFNEKYGEGNWEIGGYTNTYTIEYISNACVRNVITPIPKVKVVEEEARENGARGTIHRDLVYPQMSPKVFPGSFLSPSLGAMIMAEKYAYGLPLNRIAKKLNNLGVPVDVMTLTNWHQYICDLYLRPLDDAHKALLPKQKYLHCDESPFTVVDNGRPPGAKSYVFCLTTGELLKNENPIVVFVASESRGKDVLREIFCDPETKCVITCDAFSIYPSFEKETDHRIIVVACMMHIRRYFKKAESLLLAAGLTEDAIRDTLEHKALVLIERIYREENKLKDLLPKDRVDARLEKIKPLLINFSGFADHLHVALTQVTL